MTLRLGNLHFLYVNSDRF